MTPFQIILLIAAGIAGALASAKQSGQEPASWVPITTTIGGYLLAFAGSLQAAGSFTTASFIAALLAGFGGIGSAVAGVGLHLLHTLHLRPPTSGAGSGRAVQKRDAVTAAASNLTPPAAHRGFLRAAAVGLASAVLVVNLLMPAACKQSALPTFDDVVNVVEQDLASGASDAQMENDVCQALGFTSSTVTTICTIGAQVVQDVITALIDSGTLPSPSLTNAQAYMARHAKTSVTVTAPGGGK